MHQNPQLGCSALRMILSALHVGLLLLAPVGMMVALSCLSLSWEEQRSLALVQQT